MDKIYKKVAEITNEMTAIKKTQTNSHFGNTYFDINQLLKELKPKLKEKNLLIMQPVTSCLGDMGGTRLALETRLVDLETGETLSFIAPLPEFPDAQKAGGGITYFRRYCLVSLFNLEAEDDDGNSASGHGRTTAKKGTRAYNTEKPPFGEGADENELPSLEI